MPRPVITRTLKCDFVRNSAVTSKLILQDSFQAQVDYEIAGFHFSTSLFNINNAVTCGAWLVINNQQVIDFTNSAGVRLLGSQCLVRTSALGVSSWATRSEWVTLDRPFLLQSGQVCGLYAFASNLNTQRTFATIALSLLEPVAA